MTPEPAWIWIPPPPPLGSGKFGTPCERMHSENCRPACCLMLALELLELLEPHAARTSVLASAAATRPRRVLRALGEVRRGIPALCSRRRITAA